MAQKRERKLAVGAISARPSRTGNHHAVATGHYLASLAAMRVLDRGGNAIDAGVTASMALAILQCDMVSFAGVAPTLQKTDISAATKNRPHLLIAKPPSISLMKQYIKSAVLRQCIKNNLAISMILR
jgi:hypothetical protein